MTITVNTKAYNFDASVDANQNLMTGPSHTMNTRDTLSLRRSKSAAVPNVNPGYARAYAKFVRTVTIGGVNYDVTAEAYIAVPVGAAKADVDAIRDDLGDLLISTNGDDLVWKQDIYQ